MIFVQILAPVSVPWSVLLLHLMDSISILTLQTSGRHRASHQLILQSNFPIFQCQLSSNRPQEVCYNPSLSSTLRTLLCILCSAPSCQSHISVPAGAAVEWIVHVRTPTGRKMGHKMGYYGRNSAAHCPTITLLLTFNLSSCRGVKILPATTLQ